jgi:hypothetical protein
MLWQLLRYVHSATNTHTTIKKLLEACSLCSPCRVRITEHLPSRQTLISCKSTAGSHHSQWVANWKPIQSQSPSWVSWEPRIGAMNWMWHSRQPVRKWTRKVRIYIAGRRNLETAREDKLTELIICCSEKLNACVISTCIYEFLSVQ